MLVSKAENLAPVFAEKSKIMLLGDSKSTAFGTWRWPASLFRHWDCKWRGRVIPAIDGDVNLYTSGYGFAVANLNLGVTRKAPGSTFADGVTVMPAYPRSAHEAWFTADRTTAFAYYDVTVNALDQCLRGSWLKEAHISQSVIAVVGAGNTLNRFAVQQTRASDYGSAGSIVRMTHTYQYSAGAADSSIALRVDLRHDLDDDTGKGVWIVGNIVENASGTGVLFDNIGYSGQTAKSHYPSTWDSTGIGWSDETRLAYYAATEWPNLYIIDIGTNGGLAEIEKLVMYLSHFHEKFQGPPAKFGLIVTPDASGDATAWDALEQTIVDIVERRNDCALLNLRRYMLENYGEYADWQATYLADGVHQNEAGVDLFGAATWRMLLDGIGGQNLASVGAVRAIERRIGNASKNWADDYPG